MQSIHNENILIHIGYHKTASTFLQTQFFPREENAYFHWPGTSEKVHEMFVKLNSYQSASDETVTHLRGYVDQATQRGLTFVFSHERLSGHPASGGYDSRLIADRLQQIMPNARILIVIREQKSIIRSVYSQYITEGGGQSLARFLTPPNPEIRRMPFFDYSYFDYIPCIEYYRTLFGRNRVLVIPYEMLRKSAAGFLSKIADFTGSQYTVGEKDGGELPAVNVRQNQIVQFVRRQMNQLFFRTPHNVSGIIDHRIAFRAYSKSLRILSGCMPGMLDRPILKRQERLIEKLVGDRYSDGNRKLSGLIEIDLATFGYDCSPAICEEQPSESLMTPADSRSNPSSIIERK